ncbi:MAG: 30S ribosome-binding factor RbfA [bacterium]
MVERNVKMGEMIRQQLGEIIIEEVELPMGSIVTVTKLDLSPDFKNARAYISVVPDEFAKKVMGTLILKVKSIQNILVHKINMRVVPRIKFFLDEIEQEAMELDRLLDNLNK